MDQTSGGGGADPVSAIANAVGDLFQIFSQIGETRQTQIQTEGALLLASQPKKRETQDKTALYVLGALLIVLVVVLYIKKV